VPTVDPRFITLPAGITLAYRDWGGEGPPILLLHGLASNSRIWDWTAPLLASDHRVVALDQRSHGLSERAEDYGFDAVVADAAAVIEALGLDRPVIAGHSWGGCVALVFAEVHPAKTRGIVLVDGGFIELSRRLGWEKAEKQMLPPDIDGIPADKFVASMRQWPQIQDHWSDELGEMVLSNLEVRDGKIYRRLTIPDHMKIARAIYDLPVTDLVVSLRVPALAISCERDPGPAEREWQEYRREGIDRLKKAAPHVDVVVMEDTIHDVPIQRPADLAELIHGFAVSQRVTESAVS
jgi:pimeloyl-ACP methyl ester carboxylesterase